MTDQADILAVIDRHAAPTRAKDPDRALADFAPDLTSYTLAPPLGNEGLRPEALADWYATWRGRWATKLVTCGFRSAAAWPWPGAGFTFTEQSSTGSRSPPGPG